MWLNWRGCFSLKIKQLSLVHPAVIQGSYSYSSGIGRPQKLFGILYLETPLLPASLFHYNTLFLASNSLTQLYHHPSSQSCCQMTKKSERYNKEGTRKKEKEQGATGASLDWWLCHRLPVPVDLSAHKPRKARLQWRKIVGRRNHCFTPRLRNSQAEIHKVLELEAIEK